MLDTRGCFDFSSQLASHGGPIFDGLTETSEQRIHEANSRSQTSEHTDHVSKIYFMLRKEAAFVLTQVFHL